MQASYQQFRNFYSSIQTSPHFQSRLIQLTPGELNEQCDALFTESFSIYRMRYSQPCLIMGQLVLDNVIGLGLVHARRPCFFNGKSMQMDDCFVLHPRGDNDLALRGSGTLYVFAMNEGFIVKHAKQQSGLRIEDIIGQQEVMRFTQTRDLGQALIHVFENAQQQDIAVAQQNDVQNVTEHLINCISSRKLLHYRSNSRGNLLSRAIRFILQNIEYIEGCLCVAKKLHTSTRSLEKVFRQYLNMSPKEFINVAKVNCFREQIVYGSHDVPLKLLDLSRRVGASNYASFSKQFKNFYGKSPLKVRQEACANTL
ncbi:MAG TPA: helix-turn-helix domain-containing protein [Marinagarivorans sp.]